ncbi:tRNA(adenine(34)) deaminase, chloroplastic [Gastrolobium bilobum]|uniref:tRNA(adenine(34)) deaminase, chloroplastic n=1 Tax=Gastrolobium bilobum TaxID=150636 RepID=UPI002AAF357C|nr:tRNA(adenine(34)) deaminase, chloroplastic [Gastrolobium bilobum]
MHNTYLSSTIYAVRCNESFSLSFNGYSNFWYEIFDRTPSYCSSCCGCCDCCALSTYRVPIKPCLLNGLRQSTLLQLSASRRLILGGGDQYFSRLPAYGLLRGCNELNCSANERTVCNRNGRRIKGRCFRAASQKGGEIFHSFGSDEAEAVLSFLSEEADKDDNGIKRKNVSSSKRIEAEKKGKNVGRERHLTMSLSEKVETEKKGNLKQRETSTKDLRREYEKPNKEREAFTKGENHRKKRDVSSCSSYYSFSSGDFGSDLEVQDKIALEELSVGYEKDESNHVEGQVKEEFNRQRDDSKKLHDVSKKDGIAFGADIDWNLRKKSEKKLIGGAMQEIESTKEHQDMHSRAFRTHESDDGKASIAHKQVNRKEDNSSFVEDLDKKTKKAYIQTGNRRKHQFTDIQESGCEEVETTLLSRKTFSGREGNLEISETLLQETGDEHKKIVGSTSTTGKETSKSKKTFSGREGNLEISETLLKETSDKHKKFAGSTSTSRKDVINRSSQKYIGNSKIEDTERASDTRMKNLEVKKVSVLNSVQGVEEQHYQKGEKIIKQAKERSQQFSEVSQAHESNVEDTSTIKSKNRIKNWEENSKSSDARVTWLQTDKKTTQSVQHGKGSEVVSPLSEGYASDEKKVSSSQRTSDRVIFIPRSKLTSIVKTRESSCQTDERITNFELASEAQRPRNLSISDGIASREVSSSQGSLNLVSEAGKHVILAEGDERSSAEMLITPSSQLDRGSAHVELASGIASTEIFLETSESGSSALYERSPALLSGPYSRYGSDQADSEPSTIMAPEDALGSADRLEKSSKHFVDEFVERVRHEVTTSETQEMELTGTKLVFEDAGNQVYNSRQQGTQSNSQSKESDSSRSSGFPRTKGPSDEMWDVKEPSVEQSIVAEEPEISQETGKPIVIRTGRSLWSMIADVVRLRWGLHVGSSTSAGRSGERNSSNKSDSETRFSGQGHEETSKSNAIKETSVLPQTMSSDKLKPGKLSEGDGSDTKKLKDKGKHLEVGSSSPNTLESGSTSVVTSYASGEENASWSEDGKYLKVTTTGIKNMELPIPLPARGPPIVGEIVNTGGSDISVTESEVPIMEPVAPVQSELSGSERKEGELKQRKFQRNRQVLRDRFDDWEDAYKLELEQRRMDEMFMKEALLEAKKAADTWEVPVGAVLVQHGKIIARGCNLVEELRDSTAHAEMICIREASNFLRTWRLSDTTLYVTLEPCPMCAGAILQARIDNVVWGAPNKLLGADGSWIRLFPDGGENVSEARDIPPAPVHPFHPNIKIRRGVLATECADVMQQFFQLRRKKKKEEPSKAVTHHHPSKLLNKIHDIFHVMFCL